MYGNTPHEQTPRRFVEDDWSSENAWQERAQAGERNQAAAIFHKKTGGQIKIFASHPHLLFPRSEVTLCVVVEELPAVAMDSGGDGPKRFKKLEQSNVVLAIVLAHGERIIGDYGINRDAFFVRRFGNQYRSKGKQEGQRAPEQNSGSPQHPVIRDGAHPVNDLTIVEPNCAVYWSDKLTGIVSARD